MKRLILFIILAVAIATPSLAQQMPDESNLPQAGVDSNTQIRTLTGDKSTQSSVVDVCNQCGAFPTGVDGDLIEYQSGWKATRNPSVDSLTVRQKPTTPAIRRLYEAGNNGTNFWGHEALTALSVSYLETPADALPAANALKLFGAPVGGKTAFVWWYFDPTDFDLGTPGTISLTTPFVDAPNDSESYVRRNLGWYDITNLGYISEAPIDGKEYVRKDAGWAEATGGGTGSARPGVVNIGADTDLISGQQDWETLVFSGAYYAQAVGATAGDDVWLYINSAATAQFFPELTDQIQPSSGSAFTAGNGIENTSGALGDRLHLRALTDNLWAVLDSTGTWADAGAFPSAPVVGCDTESDTCESTGVDGVMGVGQASNNKFRGTIFTAETTGEICKCEAWMEKVGTPAQNFTFQIWPNSGINERPRGLVDGYLGTESDVIAGSNLPAAASPDWVSFENMVGVRVVEGQIYHPVVEASAIDADNYGSWHYENSECGDDPLEQIVNSTSGLTWGDSLTSQSLVFRCYLADLPTCGVDGLEQRWHMENTTITTGTPAGCDENDTTIELGSGAVIDTDGTPTPIDGSGTLYLDGTWSRAITTTTTTTLINGAKIAGYLQVETGAFTSADVVWEALYDADNKISVELYGTSTDISIGLRKITGGATAEQTQLTTTNGSLGEAQWIYFEAEWKTGVSGNDYRLKVCNVLESVCDEVIGDKDWTAAANGETYYGWGSEPSAGVLQGHIDNGRVYSETSFD